MALSIGTQLGSYEITALLGKGGMGEVYRARDLKLKREVAIKVLPEEFARDGDRLSRFQREAEVLASINHPNIGTIYDLQEANETRFLVLELVEGETLADRIARGPVPVDEALNIALQMCEALEAAHDRGIVHRDLKPANVKLTPDGKLKVLDFGLAKGMDDALTNVTTSNSPTLMSRTMGGVLIGTAAYMSPEQAVGRAVDRRADIWAFGVVLWEMLTGRPLFRGETVSHILADVIRAEIDFQVLPQTTPPVLRELLKRCLDREVKNRLRDIGEARVALSRAPTAAPESVQAIEQQRGMRAIWVWAVVATAVAVVLGFVQARPTIPENRVVSTTILPPENSTFDFAIVQAPPMFSPDGLRLVYGARDAGGKSQLWVRRLDSLKAQPLADTEGGQFPFWSPDSKSIGFFSGGKLKKLDLLGGAAMTLADAPDPRGATWSSEGVIVFGPTNGGLKKLAAAGGVVSDATTLDTTAKDLAHAFPFFLPDGRHFLFMARAATAPNKAVLEAGSLDGGPPKKLGEFDSSAIYSDGHLLYLRKTTLMAQSFDPRSLTLSGDAVPVVEQVGQVFPSSSQPLLTTAHGLLAYAAPSPGMKLTWLDRDGKPLGTLGAPAIFSAVELSPDENKVAVSLGELGDSTGSIWIVDALHGVRSRLTYGSNDIEPGWSRDGQKIAYIARGRGHRDIYMNSSDGTGMEEALLADDHEHGQPNWSPDGKVLLYGDGVSALSVLPMTPPGKPYSFLSLAYRPGPFRLSTDGRWVAYSSSGEASDIFVAPFPGPGGKRQISSGGGRYPRWRRDGKELFYVGPNSRLMSTEITIKDNSIQVGQAQSLPIPVFMGYSYMYDVSSDGKRFLVPLSVDQGNVHISLIQNWTAAFKK